MTTHSPAVSPSTTASKINWGQIAAWVVMALLIFVTLFPIWWVLRTALSDSKLIFSDTTSLLPVGFTTNNFARVLGLLSTEEAIAAGGSGQAINFFLYLRNSAIVTTLLVVAQVFFSALGAYAFARLKFPFRDQIFFLYIAALMVPGIVTFIPNFVLIRNLGWLDTFRGIVAPKFLMTPFAVFFMRQFFLSTPREIEEAARIDGAGYLRTYWSVVLPMHRSAIATLVILEIVHAWHAFLWPFLVGRDEDMRVISVALTVFRESEPYGGPDWTGLMAATALSVVPVIIMLIFFGRRVVESLQYSGIK